MWACVWLSSSSAANLRICKWYSNMDDSGEYVVTESYFSTYNLIARYSYDVCFASNGVVQLELLMSQLLYIHPWRSIRI